MVRVSFMVTRFCRGWFCTTTLLTAILYVAVPGGHAVAQVTETGEVGGAYAASKTASSSADALLTAMQQELTREQADLVLPGLQRPYFMEYRLEDIATYEAVANYGALTSETQGHQRVVRVELRIGDYKSDSSSARGDGSLALAPQEDDVAALKFALWSATDEAYKNALRAFAAKQATLKRFQSAPTADDFTPGKPVTLIEPVQTLAIDKTDWRQRLIAASGLFLTAPEARSFAQFVQSSSALVTAIAVNRYTVNSEGTMLRHGYSGYSDSIAVGGQAADGMELSRNNGSMATTAAGLESAESLRKRTLTNLLSFNELRNAPVVDAEDFHGPVLFSGDAAAEVINKLFVPNIEADRPDIGTNARTQGAYQSSLRSPVLPPFLSVVDDPTLGSFEGQALLGAYKVDDEGTPARAVTLVERGKLVSYLLGREPVKDFPTSDGHGRAALGQPAHSRAGVLMLKATPALTTQQLRARLLALAKEQGRYVYEVVTLGGGELMPRLLYRVSPAGQRTLVRGAVFDELDQRSLRSEILAAGGKTYLAQSIGPIPQSTLCPELLFGDIAVKRANAEQQKVPYYAPPPVTGSAGLQ